MNRKNKDVHENLFLAQACNYEAMTKRDEIALT